MKRLTATLVSAIIGMAPASAIAQRNSNDSQRDSSRDQNDPQAETDTFVWSTAQQGRLGVMVMGLTPELRAHFGAPKDAGLLVARVQPNSPAARAGIQVGDVLTTVGGTKVQGAADVIAALANSNGGRVPVEVIRQGKRVLLQAPLPQQNSPQDENPTI
ncbi:MAG: serine protease [Myxococcales bacterium]|nr:serine protease [Myxococcales bacterium]